MSQSTAYSLVSTDALTDHAANLRGIADQLTAEAGWLTASPLYDAAADIARDDLIPLADRIREQADAITALIAADKTNSPI